ncbi:HAD-IA family hydrolase [Jannaschia sp. S6380]|uniref:HAD-IA family hydrolase n=1 Tax=Jannaschia sp. S6380 TaxID=2926408 RepID=UPI001FF6FA2B|nr:HAD-IA family hydrolase [Jannaschia sp. S6380]MCK0165963.1 HAD-IA family hydrolase [Jannaschia sp. S6380]
MAEGLVLFDVDGTLVDGEGQISDTMAAAFAAAGLHPPTRAAVASTIGLSLPEMVQALIPPSEAGLRDKVIAGYRLRYIDALNRREEPPVFDGAETTLLRLRRSGWTLGLVTGKSRRGVDYLLDAMDWRGHFATVQCADDNISKPHPEMVLRALSETGTTVDRTVIVGDTTYDMEMGRAAGIRALGVAWGYHTADRLMRAGAEAVAADFASLALWIDGEKT